ncbi:Dynein assembly factor 6 axonemal [Taenia crassiceps]|uniref:Dynein assembly factor 6 axonemal n=1 Tax=Taenia crassiceps TaxID=6207 RepID=A0ABR4QPT7_9CEST
MNSMFTASDLFALKNLLSSQDDSSDEERLAKPSIRYNPGDIGPRKKQKKREDETSKKPPTNPNAIWQTYEIPETAYVKDMYDPRPQPEYEIHFKQDVSAEDMFLQMGPKNATTACCEYMVVTVKLPATSKEEIKLDVTEQFLDLRTKKFKLDLHLPNPVKPESSRAKWLSEKSTLEVTLANNRELDCINF